jgi:hypothetical protein
MYPTFSAIVTVHAQSADHIIHTLYKQTVRPTEIIVIVSDVAQLNIPCVSPSPKLHVIVDINRNDWGHTKRSEGRYYATSEYIGFFNADDSYTSDYIESMLVAAPADFIYCDWHPMGTAYPRANSSTSGNFIINTWLAQAVMYSGREYAADGQFIDAVVGSTKSIVHVPRCLYYHNQQLEHI